MKAKFEDVGVVEVLLHAFLTWVIDGGEWSVRLRSLYPGEKNLLSIFWESAGSPEPVWMQRGKRKNHCPCRKSNPGRPTP
jgi:hypothetical protein